MDALDRLAHQHHSIRVLIEQVATAPSDSARQSALDLLLAEFDRHAQLEEQIVYPIFEAHEILRSRMITSREEHIEASRLLDELRNTPFDDSAGFGLLLHKFRDAVLKHVREEEDEIFELARRVLKGPEMESIRRGLDQEEGTLRKAS